MYLVPSVTICLSFIYSFKLSCCWWWWWRWWYWYENCLAYAYIYLLLSQKWTAILVLPTIALEKIIYGLILDRFRTNQSTLSLLSKTLMPNTMCRLWFNQKHQRESPFPILSVVSHANLKVLYEHETKDKENITFTSENIRMSAAIFPPPKSHSDFEYLRWFILQNIWRKKAVVFIAIFRLGRCNLLQRLNESTFWINSNAEKENLCCPRHRQRLMTFY